MSSSSIGRMTLRILFVSCMLEVVMYLKMIAQLMVERLVLSYMHH